MKKIFATILIILLAGGTIYVLYLYFGTDSGETTPTPSPSARASPTENPFGVVTPSTGSTSSPQATSGQAPTPTQTPTPSPTATPSLTPEQAKISEDAKVFMETYATYSNRDDFGNFRDTLTYMTKRLAIEQEAYSALIAERQDPDAPVVTVKTVVEEDLVFLEFTALYAKVLAPLVETRTVGEGAAVVSNRTVELTFVNVQGTYLVDVIKWN